jgi:hypothetical protein
MDHGTPLPVTVVEDTKPTLSPPSSSSPTLPVPNPGNASSSQIPPPSPPGFMVVQCDLILALCRDNDEQKFKQELMEKKLDWLLDSGSEDPQQRHNEEDLLQVVMVPKWSDSSSMFFLVVILVNRFSWLVLFWSS